MDLLDGASGGGDMYGAGSNVASRESNIQVSNVNANRYWYTETIYSRNRDKTLYPTPSKYVVPLSRTYKQVLGNLKVNLPVHLTQRLVF